MPKNMNQTVVTDASIEEYFESVENEKLRDDAKAIHKIMKKVSKKEPKIWGENIVGYGSYHYVYATKREGDWMRIGFSARKNGLSVYLLGGFERMTSLLKGLGRHKHGKSCLNIKSLDHVDMKVLEEIIRDGWKHMNELYPPNKGVNKASQKSSSSKTSSKKPTKAIKRK